jgi:hypothetical protein
MGNLVNKRAKIKEYIYGTTLPKIDGAGNYTHNLKLISREFTDVNELRDHDLPACFLIGDAPTQYYPLTAEQYVTGTSEEDLTNGMTLFIVGVIKENRKESIDKAGDMEQSLDDLYADICLAMLSDDLRKGGYAESTILRGMTPSIQWGESHGYGILVMEFSIKYRFNPRATNPSV